MTRNTAASALAAAVLALLATACGTTTNSGATASPTPSNTGSTPTPTPAAGYTQTTIYDLQTGATTASTIELDGVVVTAIMPVHSGISFWAQDAGGGQYSGVEIYDLGGKTPVTLAVGDVVTIRGTHEEYSPASYPWHSTQTEIVPDDVEVTDHSSPTVDKVTDLTELADVAGEPWEGCLVQIENLHVSSVGVGYGEYGVSDSSGVVRIDRAIADTFEPRIEGEAIGSITGVVEDAWDHYHVAPRSADDVAGTAVNTPVALTIADLQDKTSPNHPARGQLVTISDVLVSATAPWTSSSGRSKLDFWAQTAAQAAAKNGLFVQDLNYTRPGVNAGDTVTVTGKYVELGNGASGLGTNTSTALILFADNPVGTPTATAATITPLALTLATLKGSHAGDYDGVFVQLTDAAVTVSDMNPDAPKDYGEYSVTDGTDAVRVDKYLYDSRANVALNDSITLLRGLFYKKAGTWRIEPRSADDVTKQ